MSNFDSEDLINRDDFLGDYDDEPIAQGDGMSTAVSAGGIGMTPEQASVVPSFNARRKKRRSASIAVTPDAKEAGGFQTATTKIA